MHFNMVWTHHVLSFVAGNISQLCCVLLSYKRLFRTMWLFGNSNVKILKINHKLVFYKHVMSLAYNE